MSEQLHTPEPWRHDYANTLNVYSQGDCGLVYEICKFPDTDRGVLDLLRTMACVNACAGISTLELERVRIVELPNPPYHELKQQRDELLAAAQAARLQIAKDRDDLFECHKNQSTGRMETDDVIGRDGFNKLSALINQLDSAIAKVESK